MQGNHLINNRVSQKDYFIYFILSGLPIFSTLVIDLRFSKFYKELNSFTSFGISIISILLVIYLYKINKSIDHKKFFERFFSINFIIRIKLLIFFMIPFVIINFFIKQKLNLSMEKYLIISHFASYINLILYSIIVIREFKSLKKIINKNKESTVTSVNSAYKSLP